MISIVCQCTSQGGGWAQGGVGRTQQENAVRQQHHKRMV